VADFAVEAIDRALAKVTVPTAVHMCYGYSKSLATKQASPLYGQAIELLAATTADAMTLEYEQPAHEPELLTHAGDKTVILGVLNLDTAAAVETADHIESRARAAMEVVGRDRLQLAPDCGMWFLPRDRAMAKLVAMETAAARMRR
jgi:5-methyltetrahydropteroyltriglutamate--homocysteine methyltransferase